MANRKHATESSSTAPLSRVSGTSPHKAIPGITFWLMGLSVFCSCCDNRESVEEAKESSEAIDDFTSTERRSCKASGREDPHGTCQGAGKAVERGKTSRASGMRGGECMQCELMQLTGGCGLLHCSERWMQSCSGEKQRPRRNGWSSCRQRYLSTELPQLSCHSTSHLGGTRCRSASCSGSRRKNVGRSSSRNECCVQIPVPCKLCILFFHQSTKIMHHLMSYMVSKDQLCADPPGRTPSPPPLVSPESVCAICCRIESHVRWTANGWWSVNPIVARVLGWPSSNASISAVWLLSVSEGGSLLGVDANANRNSCRANIQTTEYIERIRVPQELSATEVCMQKRRVMQAGESGNACMVYLSRRN